MEQMHVYRVLAIYNKIFIENFYSNKKILNLKLAPIW